MGPRVAWAVGAALGLGAVVVDSRCLAVANNASPRAGCEALSKHPSLCDAFKPLCTWEGIPDEPQHARRGRVAKFVFFAVIGGLLTSASNNVIAYPKHLWGELSYGWSAGLFATNIVLNFGSVGCFLMGARFGPVAVVMPLLTATKLLSNMIFQHHTGIEWYSKSTRVGTYVLTLASFCLIDLGPEPAEEQVDVTSLLSTLSAAVWLSVMTLTLIGGVVTSRFVGRGRDEWRALVLSIVVGISTALGASVGKVLVNASGVELAVSGLLYFVCGALSFGFGAVAAFSCNMSFFLPMSECLQLIVNCCTGLFVWGDARRTRNLTLYLLTYLLIVLGVYLCSSLDLIAGVSKLAASRRAASKAARTVTVTSMPSTSTTLPAGESEGSSDDTDHDIKQTIVYV